MKTATLFFLLLVACLQGRGQLLNESFNSSLSSSWAQISAGSWSLSLNLDANGSGCIFTESNLADSAGIVTPVFNLSGSSSLTITFKLAIVGNNYLPPNLALSYNSGAGRQFLARWGMGFSPNTTDTITDYGYDYNPPLEAQHILWHNASCTLAAMSGATASLVFDAELYNGGYVLLDSLVVTGHSGTLTGIKNNAANTGFLIFPNPAKDKTVQLKGGPLKSLLLINTLGQALPAVYQYSGNNMTEVNLADLPAGVYYLDAVMESGSQLKRKLIIE